MDLSAKIKSINNRSDLAGFVNDLARDFRENPEGWENRDLGVYLEALAAWIDDMDGYFHNSNVAVPEKPDWSILAVMLIAAKSYE